MIVLDTNIVVAALWSRDGASHRLLQSALSGSLACAVSVALALEYEAVLKRAAIREVSWATLDEVDVILDGLFAQATLIERITTRLRPTLSDPADEMVLECAVEANASVIVTMNLRDFMPAKTLFGIDVLQPGQMLARLRLSGVAT